MTTNEPLISTISDQIQFLVDNDGKPTAIQISIPLWRRVVAALEDAEDRALAQQALATLDAAGGDLDKAGFLDWNNVRAELEMEDAQE